MLPIFVYGTLQFPDIAAAVAGRPLQGRGARLVGYARFQVQRAPFPGIAPRPGARVDGLVYEDVDAAALARIDAFEGELYRRERVCVEPHDGDGPLQAQTYVVRPRWRSALRDRDWDPEAFAREWHAAYLREFGGVSAAGGRR
ncbi:MAG: gamma-glutamylcyclotransferase family protein [Halofilum sp. (in: g-proteobacteria)]|nr:gamma-glutamylcyclotransferase family protein [Halofilum sp. (in: g-proteobacteria)]